jgi:7-cyano-7-deazaguanine synthase in queuosine biosynthesis
MKISVLYSGGLDSFIMYHMAKLQHPNDEVVAIYYDHGQPVAEKEIANLPDFVEVRKVDWLSQEKTPIAQPGRREGAIMIPGRNLVFGTLIACQELPDEIWMGALKGETHEKGTDKNYTFLEHLNTTINYVLGPFKHHSPIKARFPLADAGLDKLGEVVWALDNGLTQEDLLSTRSCHDGDSDACGQCIQCIKRWAVFGECGFEEQYDVHPLESEFGKQFVYDMLNCALGNDDYYGEETRAEMIPFILFYADKYPEKYENRTLELIKQLADK